MSFKSVRERMDKKIMIDPNIETLKTKGFDFVVGGNSASYILRVFEDHEAKIKELKANLVKEIEAYSDLELKYHQDTLKLEQRITKECSTVDELEKKLAEAVERIEQTCTCLPPSEDKCISCQRLLKIKAVKVSND